MGGGRIWRPPPSPPGEEDVPVSQQAARSSTSSDDKTLCVVIGHGPRSVAQRLARSRIEYNEVFRGFARARARRRHPRAHIAPPPRTARGLFE
jgi:hypothetical protein